MFDGMEKRDAAMIKKPLLSGGTMVLMRDGKPSQMTFEDFADRVGKPGTTHIQERIYDPLVRIDQIWRWSGPLSSFWWMARWTIAGRTCSILFERMENGLSPVSQNGTEGLRPQVDLAGAHS